MSNLKKYYGFIIFFFICSIMFSQLSSHTIKAERNLYIGDMIRLNIDGTEYTKEELQTLFKGFELVDVSVEQQMTVVTLRCLEIGTKTVLIGNQEIEITVASALADVQRDAIYDFEPILKQPAFTVPWLFVEVFLIGIFILSGILYAINFLKMKKNKILTPYACCVKSLREMSLSEHSFLALMTGEVKYYIQREFSTQVIGKTTDEFKQVVSEIMLDETIKRELYMWLNESDFYKFSGTDITIDKKENMRKTLMELVERIHTFKPETIQKEVTE